MASKIRIHRSTGAAAPSSLEFGELAATVEQGTAGTSGNKAGRLFIGNVAGNPVEIGGEYIYKLIDHTPGQTHPTSALVTDSNGNIDGIKIAGISTITRTDITDAVTQNLRVTGVTTFAQGVILNGNTTIGNAVTDLLTINARTTVVTDLTLNDGLTVAGVTTTNGAIDANGTVDFGADVVFNSATNDITFDQSASKIIFKDNNKANFGSADDLSLYHNGSNSFITNTEGYLRISNSSGFNYIDQSTLRIRNAAGSENLANFISGGAVELFFAGNRKAKTTATGFEVTDTNMVLTSTHNAPTHTVGTGATFTGSFHLGSGGTNYRFPVARGANDQILISDANGQLAFEDVPGTLVISAGYASTDAVQLLPDVLTIAATDNETKTTLTDNKITVGLATDVRVGGGLTVANNCHIIGNLTVDGTETVLNTIRLDVQDNKVGVGSTSTASNTTADGCGYFVHAGSDGNKEILYEHNKTAFRVNQHWIADGDNTKDLGASDREWRNLYIDNTAYIDALEVHNGATISAGADVTFTGSTSGENILWDSSEGFLKANDNVPIYFGTSGDFEIKHTGSHSYIKHTGPGNLYTDVNVGDTYSITVNESAHMADFAAGGAVTLRFNGNEKFVTTNTGTNVTGVHVDDGATHDGDVTFTGASHNVVWDKSDDQLEFADNATLSFGASDDLKIYHSGGNSSILNNTGVMTLKNQGSGKLQLMTQGAQDVEIKTNNELSLKCNNDGAVELYHDAAKKLDTTAYGIDVTGTTQSDTLIVTGVSTVASMIFSAGTNTNGVAYFNAGGQVTSTINPSNSVTTSFKILTTDTNGVPTWTSTIDCGTF